MSVEDYKILENKLRLLRQGKLEGYTDEYAVEHSAIDEDALLDQMDDVWWNLSAEEKLRIEQGLE